MPDPSADAGIADAAPGDDVPPAARLRLLSVAILGFVAGTLLCTWCGVSWDDAFTWGLIAALPVALIRPMRRRVSDWLQTLRHPSPGRRRVIALCVGLLTVVLCAVQVIRVDRELMPQSHDEHSYWLQATQLAHGRLWYPPHPEAEFFESFHILTDEVYGSSYWPGAALMHVPGVWLGLPPYAWALVVFGALVAAVYLLASRLADGVAGLVAALGAAVLFDYYGLATQIGSQPATALLGVTLVLVWMDWRAAELARRWRQALLMGACAGWMGITRPVDALALALPVGLAVIGEMVLDSIRTARSPSAATTRWHGAWRPALATIAAGLLGALPFLGLQAVQNYGMTGDVLTPPYVRYFEKYQPGLVFATDGVASLAQTPRPETSLPQKLGYYDGWLATMSIDESRNSLWWRISQRRLPGIVRLFTPNRIYTAFAAVGALVALGALGRATRWPAPPLHLPMLVLAATAAAWVLLYELNPTFLPHYALTLGAVTLPLTAVGVRTVESCGAGRLRPALTTLLIGAFAAWYIVTLWTYPQRYNRMPGEMHFKYHAVPELVPPGRALILVRFGGTNVHVEPVYNSGVPWPNDARIVWAHDLEGGGRAGEILEYYRSRQPDRKVFLMFRPELKLHPMGGVREALETFNAGNWPAAPPQAPELR